MIIFPNFLVFYFQYKYVVNYRIFLLVINMLVAAVIVCIIFVILFVTECIMS